MSPVSVAQCHDLMETLDDSHGVTSTVVVS